MIDRRYPYRFKTKKEFIEKWCEDWRRQNPVFFNEEMDYLLGTVFEVDVYNTGFFEGRRHLNIPRQVGTDYWEIHFEHLEERQLIPSYNPKKFIRV